jgi:hypothetical protein
VSELAVFADQHVEEVRARLAPEVLVVEQVMERYRLADGVCRGAEHGPAARGGARE